MYDLIGDIHGYADELERLLDTLGYRKTNGVYGHPDRKAIFLGDLIDRGPKIRQVLEIVRAMIEEENALAVMGNHELNALAFHTEDPERAGVFLRPRTTKNIRQYGQTILQLNETQLNDALAWFRTLPMWLDLDGLRVVHACWDDVAIAAIEQAITNHQGITPTLIQSARKEGNDLFRHVEVVLKGKEAMLPQGISYADKDGHLRSRIRTRWYLPPERHTYRTYAFQTEELACDAPLDPLVCQAAIPYPSSAKPVFLGHFGMREKRPQILAENVACLDYGIVKGGFLCAYRWHGEQRLKDDNFVWVQS